MDKTKLVNVNGLIHTVYDKKIFLSALLEEFLSKDELDKIRNEYLARFLDVFVFAIQCRFATLPEGDRLYSILSEIHGLEGAKKTMVQIALSQQVSRQRVSQLHLKAIKQSQGVALKNLCSVSVQRVAIAQKTRIFSAPKRQNKNRSHKL